jgi:hypothetical protein
VHACNSTISHCMLNWNLLKLKATKVYKLVSWNKKKVWKNKKNYTKTSSHKSILGWESAFALSLNRSNSVLNTLQRLMEWGTPLKITSLRIIHMEKHIAPIIFINSWWDAMVVWIGTVSSSAFRRKKKKAWHTIAPKRTISNITGLAILRAPVFFFSQVANMSLSMMI